MDVLRKFKASSYAVSIVYIIVGLIMLLNPDFISHAVNYVIGILVIIYGVFYTVSIYQKKDTGMYSKFDLLAGIICISFGLFLILNPDMLVSLIPFCTGVVLFMDAISFIINSFALKKLESKTWYINLIIGIIFLGFSIFVMVTAKNISLLLIRFIGGFLIVDALLDFLTVIRLNRGKKISTYSVVEAEVKE